MSLAHYGGFFVCWKSEVNADFQPQKSHKLCSRDYEML